MDKTVNLSAERIKAKHEEYGYSQKTLARYCSVSVSTIKNWESGTHFPGKDELLRLAAVLHTTPNYLIAYDDNNYFVIEETTAEERQVLSEMHRLYHLQLNSSKD